MKLRNKKTGEIVDLSEGFISDTFDGEKIQIRSAAISYDKEGYVYSSLAELNADWEDYEDEDVEEEFWYVDTDCETYGVSRAFNQNNSDDVLFNKSIGNYFETEEEAEKAVEKLKAWKRLKDKGFRFMEGWLDNNDVFIIKAKLGHVGLIDQPDVHLLFGGEE